VSVSISEQQFLELYDKNVGKIYRYIFFRVGSEETAQDLTSEVFLKSWQYLNQNQKPKTKNQKLENPRAFFYQVARNLIIDFYRQRDKMPLSLEEIADKSFADKIADKKDGPIEKVSRALELESVKKALVQLNADYQEVIIWRYLDELEIKEMAEILNKSEGAVRTLLSRALANLKEILSVGI
jgi:RNA polymerase sigma-70 factor (ECF subfamily)